MSRRVEFEISGTPAPQGSKRALTAKDGHAFMIEMSNAKLRTWRAMVKAAALEQAQTFDGPTSVEVVFHLAMPKSDPHRYRHFTTPDVDKLLRGLLDGLVEGKLLADDKIVWRVTTTKVYDATWTGAEVAVSDDTANEYLHGEESREAAKRAKADAKTLAVSGKTRDQ